MPFFILSFAKMIDCDEGKIVIVFYIGSVFLVFSS